MKEPCGKCQACNSHVEWPRDFHAILTEWLDENMKRGIVVTGLHFTWDPENKSASASIEAHPKCG